MALSDDDDSGGSSSTIRAWAQMPATLAVGEAAKLRIEARLLELVSAARDSQDPKLAYLAGCISTDAYLVETIVKESTGKDVLIYSIRFEKSGKR